MKNKNQEPKEIKKINKKALKYARSIHKHLPYPLPIGENDLIKAYIAGAVDFNVEVEDGPDWEQRRYEIAKEIMPQIWAHPIGSEDYSIDLAIKYADLLIKKLKEAGNE